MFRVPRDSGSLPVPRGTPRSINNVNDNVAFEIHAHSDDEACEILEQTNYRGSSFARHASSNPLSKGTRLPLPANVPSFTARHLLPVGAFAFASITTAGNEINIVELRKRAKAVLSKESTWGEDDLEKAFRKPPPVLNRSFNICGIRLSRTYR